MNMTEFSERVRLTPHTLRYYEKIGLLSDVKRNKSGHRAYTSKDVEWVNFIVRLKETGMPLERILEYSRLRALGDCTIDKRRELLEGHRDRLKLRIENELSHLQALEEKIKHYSTQ